MKVISISISNYLFDEIEKQRDVLGLSRSEFIEGNLNHIWVGKSTKKKESSKK